MTQWIWPRLGSSSSLSLGAQPLSVGQAHLALDRALVGRVDGPDALPAPRGTGSRTGVIRSSTHR